MYKIEGVSFSSGSSEKLTFYKSHLKQPNSNLWEKVDFVGDHRRQTTLLLKRVIELQNNAWFQLHGLG